jgi:hypothetical protein
MASTIILSDNGASSGSAGLKSSGGNDGVLILQTTTSGGTATNAVYVDNKQNIGVQVTPAAWTSSVKAIQLGARTSLFQYNGTTTDLMNNGYFNGTDYLYLETATATFYRQSTGRHLFYSAASGTAGAAIAWTNVLQVEKDYTLALQGGTSGAGTGITFPATQSASTDANTLDDYEEGTWTPAIGNQSVVYTTQAGRYTKVGNLVTVWAMMVITSKSGNGAEASIQGLPFASSANLGSLYPATGCIGRTYSPGGLMPTNNANFVSIESTIAYIRYPSGSGASLSVDQLGSSGGIGLFATYYV